MKTFTSHFDLIKSNLENNKHFAFIRFSDGELFILQNKRLELNENHFIIGDQVGGGWYNKEEQKQFLPDKHQFFREKLIESLKYNEPNFYRGICTQPDCDNETFKWMVDLAGGDSETLTWAALMINGNYERYLKEIVPIFSSKDIILIVNEGANINNLPFKVKKDFRVGTNCLINNYDLIDEIEKYVIDNDIKDHLFLVSAATLSNLIIHRLHKLSKDNSYLEIGSSLNPIMDMVGWKGSRAYLREFWMNENRHYLNMYPVWE
jgi:hypothetical protein